MRLWFCGRTCIGWLWVIWVRYDSGYEKYKNDQLILTLQLFISDGQLETQLVPEYSLPFCTLPFCLELRVLETNLN